MVCHVSKVCVCVSKRGVCDTDNSGVRRRGNLCVVVCWAVCGGVEDCAGGGDDKECDRDRDCQGEDDCDDDHDDDMKNLMLIIKK